MGIRLIPFRYLTKCCLYKEPKFFNNCFINYILFNGHCHDHRKFLATKGNKIQTSTLFAISQGYPGYGFDIIYMCFNTFTIITPIIVTFHFQFMRNTSSCSTLLFYGTCSFTQILSHYNVHEPWVRNKFMEMYRLYINSIRSQSYFLNTDIGFVSSFWALIRNFS